jgi:hypothetical protein
VSVLAEPGVCLATKAQSAGTSRPLWLNWDEDRAVTNDDPIAAVATETPDWLSWQILAATQVVEHPESRPLSGTACPQRSVFRKLGVGSRTAVWAWADERGLLR